ncbi:hypothetical protein BDW67DRAFT_180302 [Aspergillus spinulosporus]
MAKGLQYDLGQIYLNIHPNGALRRRLWWCLYTRDRLLALTARLPMYIREGDYNVPMLMLADFESCYATEDAYLALGLEPNLRAIGTKNALALTFIYKAKRCLCIERILTSQCFLGPASAAMGYHPQTTPLSASDFYKLQTDLDAWRLSLPSLLQFSLPMMPPNSDTDEIIYGQRDMLHMMYLTVLNALHRSWSHSAQQADGPWEHTFQTLSTWEIECTSRDITTIANNLQDNNLTTGLQTPLGPSFVYHDIVNVN